METSYLQGLFYCSESIMCKRLHLEAEESPFSHLSLSASKTLITPIVLISCQSGGSWFSLSAQGTSLLTRFVVFCHGPASPSLCPYLLPACYNIYVVWLNKSSKLDNYLPWKLKNLSLSHWYDLLCCVCVCGVCVCVLYFMSVSAITWRNWIKKLILLDNQMLILLTYYQGK